MRAHILNINASEPIEVLGGAHVSQQRCNMAGRGDCNMAGGGDCNMNRRLTGNGTTFSTVVGAAVVGAAVVAVAPHVPCPMNKTLEIAGSLVVRFNMHPFVA